MDEYEGNEMTTKLIQELVGLAVEKSKDRGLPITVTQWVYDGKIDKVGVDVYGGCSFIRSMSFENAPAQLQAAIDEVKAL
jgi:hypothetical protein